MPWRPSSAASAEPETESPWVLTYTLVTCTAVCRSESHLRAILSKPGSHQCLDLSRLPGQDKEKPVCIRSHSAARWLLFLGISHISLGFRYSWPFQEAAAIPPSKEAIRKRTWSNRKSHYPPTTTTTPTSTSVLSTRAVAKASFPAFVFKNITRTSPGCS